MVALQLQAHLSASNLLDPYQCGFQSGHSSDIALLKITNDLLVSADSGCITVLILLDLTAAFDTYLIIRAGLVIWHTGHFPGGPTHYRAGTCSS